MPTVDRVLARRRAPWGVLAACVMSLVLALTFRGGFVHLAAVFLLLVLTGPAALVCGGACALDGIGRRWAGARSAGAGARVVVALVGLWAAVIASLPMGMAIGAWLESKTETWASARRPLVERFEREHDRRAKHEEYWQLVGPPPWYAQAANVRYDTFTGRLVRAD